jgi:hypothetical protein
MGILLSGLAIVIVIVVVVVIWVSNDPNKKSK